MINYELLRRFRAVVILLEVFFSQASLAASAHRKCIIDSINKSLANLNCDFNNLNEARQIANSKCSIEIVDEVDPMSPDAKEEIDNLKRAGNGDIDELALKKADKCGVSLTIVGNTITVSKTTRYRNLFY